MSARLLLGALIWFACATTAFAQFPSSNVRWPTFVVPTSFVNGGGAFPTPLYGPVSCTVPAYAFQGAATTGTGGTITPSVCWVVNGTAVLTATGALLTSAVPVTVSGKLDADNLESEAAGFIRWGSRTILRSAGSGLLSLLTTSDNVGVGLAFTVDGKATWTTREGGTAATQIGSSQATDPTCTANCGTSPSVTGSDSDFRVTMGASGSPASGWVITFNGTWDVAPVCSVSMGLAGMVVGKLPLTVETTTTTMTVVTNGTAPANGDIYGVSCRGPR